MSDKNSTEKYSLSVCIEEKNALSIFNGSSVDRIVGDIEDEVRGFAFDVSSVKGRKDIASMAHKVSRSKTALDGLGKSLVGDWKAKAKVVDQERKMLRDRLDALRDEVRRPLTEWEEAEAKKAEEEAVKKEIAQAFEFAVIENELFDKNREIQRREEEAEKERIDAARIKAAEEKKAANKKHRAAVNNGILKELLVIGITEEHGKEIITLAAKGLIKNLSVMY